MLHRIGTALVVLLTLACVSLEAWAAKVGPPFRVNTYRPDVQSQPSVAQLSDGGFVVVWASQQHLSFSYDINGQRYSALGGKVGGEFRVNTRTADNQFDPSVAGLSGGGFVVTWSSKGQDGGSYGVYAQRYSGAGVKAGNEFRVNSATMSYQWDSSVAGLTGGGFVVTWTSHLQDGFGEGVYGKRYTATGVPQGLEFRVNNYPLNNQNSSSVAALSNGGFVVTWASQAQDGSHYGIYGQRYGATGAKAGGEFRANTNKFFNQNEPSVTGLTGGGFVVIWTSQGTALDGDVGVYGQRYNAAGTKVGTEFLVNNYTSGPQDNASVTGLTDGHFVVMWQSDSQFDVRGRFKVYGQRYNTLGARVGTTNFEVYTANAQREPSIAGVKDGGFIVIWYDRTRQDVYGQRYNQNQ